MFVAQVQGAELRRVDDRGAGVDAVCVHTGVDDPPDQPAVAARRVQHPARGLGQGGERGLDPPGAGGHRGGELDDGCVGHSLRLDPALELLEVVVHDVECPAHG